MRNHNPGDPRKPPRRPGEDTRARARLAALIGEAIRLAWQAGRRELTILIVLDLLSAGLVIAEVLLGRVFLSEVLAAERTRAGTSSALPSALVLAGLTAALAGVAAAAAYYQRVLAELATRHAQNRVLDVTEAVELIEFEDAAFFDRVARAQIGAQRVAPVITSLSGLLRAATAAGGALVGLVVLAPLLAPLVLLVLAPALYAASRRSRLFYRHAFELTPMDRERIYLERLLTEREAAQEVRAFDLAGFLRPLSRAPHCHRGRHRLRSLRVGPLPR